jgi:hypothetical protein
MSRLAGVIRFYRRANLDEKRSRRRRWDWKSGNIYNPTGRNFTMRVLFTGLPEERNFFDIFFMRAVAQASPACKYFRVASHKLPEVQKIGATGKAVDRK